MWSIGTNYVKRLDRSEIDSGVGLRTLGQKFGQTDGVRQKYAGMETDDATGMAHTLWRKQDNWSGRWTSPDPYGGSMTTADPQSFDRSNYRHQPSLFSTSDSLGGQHVALGGLGIFFRCSVGYAEKRFAHGYSMPPCGLGCGHLP
jgi:RHS repeat-associated protein